LWVGDIQPVVDGGLFSSWDRIGNKLKPAVIKGLFGFGAKFS